MPVIVVYTDGACSGNGTTSSSGGIGVHFPEWPNMQLQEALPPHPPPTNNRAELLAVLRALQQCDVIDPSRTWPVLIKSDSQLVCNTLNSWMASWKKRGWLKSDRKTPLNLDLLQQLDNLMSPRNVTLRHVRAHTSGRDEDSLHNAVADRLATASLHDQ